MNRTRSRTAASLTAVFGLVGALLAGGGFDPVGAQGKPEGEMRWALYVIDPYPWSAPLEEVRLKSK